DTETRYRLLGMKKAGPRRTPLPSPEVAPAVVRARLPRAQPVPTARDDVLPRSVARLATLNAPVGTPPARACKALAREAWDTNVNTPTVGVVNVERPVRVRACHGSSQCR